jgi:TonB family protein
MKKLIFIAILFCTSSIQAQYHWRIFVPELKGEVEKIETTIWKNVSFDNNNQPILNKPAEVSVMKLVNNKVAEIKTYKYSNSKTSKQLVNKMEIEYENDKIKLVREYVISKNNSEIATKFHTISNFLYKNDFLYQEEVKDNAGKLTTLFVYKKPKKTKTGQLLEFDEFTFPNGIKTLGMRYGILSDKDRKYDMFQIRNKDTILSIKNNYQLNGDFSSSLSVNDKELGLNQKLNSESKATKDKNGNQILLLIKFANNSKTHFDVGTTKYRYKGDPEIIEQETNKEPEITRRKYRSGDFVNIEWEEKYDKFNLKFTQEVENTGTWTSKKSRVDSFEGVTNSSFLWIDEIEEKGQGEWSYDPILGVLTIKSRNKEINKVKVEIKENYLVLKPLKEDESTLVLKTIIEEVMTVAEEKKPDPELEKSPKIELSKDETVYDFVEETPKLANGLDVFEYLAKNLKYPRIAAENGVEGTVVVTFIVEKNGSISNINLVRDINGGCGQEAKRLISQMPKWIPGKQKGVPVRVKYTLPVKFKLS